MESSAEYIPEALDEGELPADAFRKHLEPNTDISSQLAREIAQSLRDHNQVEDAYNHLEENNIAAAARILLAICDNSSSRGFGALLPDSRLPELLRRCSALSPWEVSQRLTAAADQTTRSGTRLLSSEVGLREMREMRQEGRRLARYGLHRLARKEQHDETARAAAAVIDREELRSDLLALTYDPPATLRAALASRAHLNPRCPPANLRNNPPELIAARLHQHQEQRQNATPASRRWLHTRHPVLWLTGHDEQAAQKAPELARTTPQPNIEALLLSPQHWYRTASTASRRSLASITDAAAHGLDETSSAIAQALAPEWRSGLEDLQRTAAILGGR